MNLDVAIRLSVFVGVLALMSAWELLFPRRALSRPKVGRWTANLSIVVLDALLIRALFAAGAVGASLLAAERGWGVLNQLSGPSWLEFLLAIVALDVVLYGQHVMFHAVPLFWRFHMMHHADLDCDVTTGLRFHPVEVVLSMGIKLGAVLVIGPAPAAVLAFEVLLNATSMFNHSNVWLPPALDRALRWFLVTPDMHRIHHSILPNETNSNFGFNLPWWDRLFGTYRPEPKDGQTGMVMGLEQFREPRRLTLMGSLLLPFQGTLGRYPLIRKNKTSSEQAR
ncbi:sterol desaturase family protein [Nitrospira moscoviensis]|uniref:Sterol desaturase n=1 Tax=Nitrospira moscoviensis TaxID=42253 RepID=A0A0K2GCZ9_NITMO|nr:sterol desaturase family protein [Nitrospira moscoviensis]ALA58836.1 Sterol desaturase [Nitrospira moscoviensis]